MKRRRGERGDEVYGVNVLANFISYLPVLLSVSCFFWFLCSCTVLVIHVTLLFMPVLDLLLALQTLT